MLEEQQLRIFLNPQRRQKFFPLPLPLIRISSPLPIPATPACHCCFPYCLGREGPKLLLLSSSWAVQGLSTNLDSSDGGRGSPLYFPPLLLGRWGTLRVCGEVKRWRRQKRRTLLLLPLFQTEPGPYIAWLEWAKATLESSPPLGHGEQWPWWVRERKKREGEGRGHVSVQRGRSGGILTCLGVLKNSPVTASAAWSERGV